MEGTEVNPTDFQFLLCQGIFSLNCRYTLNLFGLKTRLFTILHLYLAWERSRHWY